MPNRIIRESARTSPTLDQLSDGAERLFWRETTACDDHGRFDADPRVMLAQCFPLKVGVLTPGEVEKWREEWAAAGLAVIYEVDGRQYGAFVKWPKHQRVRATASKFPAQDEGRELRQSAAIGGESPQVAATRGLESRNRGVEESRSRKSDAARSGGQAPPSLAHTNGFIPSAIRVALDRTQRLGAVARLRDPAFWQAELAAYPGVEVDAEILKAEAWLAANQRRAPKKDLARFLHNWIGRAGEQPV